MWLLSWGWTVQGFFDGLNEYPDTKSLRNHSDLDLMCLLWERPAGSKSSQLYHPCSPHARSPTFQAWRAKMQYFCIFATTKCKLLKKCNSQLLTSAPAPYLIGTWMTTGWQGVETVPGGWLCSPPEGAAWLHSTFPQDQPMLHTHCGHQLPPAGNAGRTARVGPIGDAAAHPPWLPCCCQ